MDPDFSTFFYDLTVNMAGIQNYPDTMSVQRKRLLFVALGIRNYKFFHVLHISFIILHRYYSHRGF